MKETFFINLNWTDRLKVYYFLLSFMALCISDASLWITAAIVLNFGNAARLIRKVPFNNEEEY